MYCPESRLHIMPSDKTTRDYDTMHRGKGNLTGIEKRRALNPAIVGGGKKAENGSKDAILSSEEEEVGLEDWINSCFFECEEYILNPEFVDQH